MFTLILQVDDYMSAFPFMIELLKGKNCFINLRSSPATCLLSRSFSKHWGLAGGSEGMRKIQSSVLQELTERWQAVITYGNREWNQVRPRGGSKRFVEWIFPPNFKLISQSGMAALTEFRNEMRTNKWDHVYEALSTVRSISKCRYLWILMGLAKVKVSL